MQHYNSKFYILNSSLSEANNGYIALTSAIIISIIVMAIIFSMSISAYFSRFNTLNSGLKETSYALAEGCADTALLKLAQNSSYAGNETVTINSDACSILPLETSSTQKIIKTQANFGGAYTNLKITVSSTPLSVVFWEELPNL